MNILQKLFGGSSSQPNGRAYLFSVKCNRCGEIISARVNLEHDLSADYEDSAEVYYTRKTLMGADRCFQRIEVELKFNAKRVLIEKQITGGEFIP